MGYSQSNGNGSAPTEQNELFNILGLAEAQFIPLEKRYNVILRIWHNKGVFHISINPSGKANVEDGIRIKGRNLYRLMKEAEA